MPKSKRDKKISLTKTKKKGLQLKQQVVEEVRKSAEKYENIILFTVDNMRNAKLKDLRAKWSDSRFFFGKNKVMALGLGRTASDEVGEGVHHLSKRLIGQCGLLFTSRPVKQAIESLKEFVADDFARAGFVATRGVSLPEGPLEDFPHSMEPHLRQLGLPTSLQRGVVTLIKAHDVCKKGQQLTPEQARILKLLGVAMATFRLAIKCYWAKDGGFGKVDCDDDDQEDEGISENEDDGDSDEEMEE